MTDEYRTRADRRDAKRDAERKRLPKHGHRLAEIYRRAWEKRAKEADEGANDTSPSL